MNPLIKNFLFSSLKTQFENTAKKGAKKKAEKTGEPEIIFGDFLGISFLVTKERTLNKMKFQHHEHISVLTDEEKNKFAKMVSIDIDKEFNSKSDKNSPCESIYVECNVPKKSIEILYTYEDKTNKKIVL